MVDVEMEIVVITISSYMSLLPPSGSRNFLSIWFLNAEKITHEIVTLS